MILSASRSEPKGKIHSLHTANIFYDYIRPPDSPSSFLAQVPEEAAEGIGILFPILFMEKMA